MKRKPRLEIIPKRVGRAISSEIRWQLKREIKQAAREFIDLIKVHGFRDAIDDVTWRWNNYLSSEWLEASWFYFDADGVVPVAIRIANECDGVWKTRSLRQLAEEWTESVTAQTTKESDLVETHRQRDRLADELERQALAIRSHDYRKTIKVSGQP